MSSNKIIVFIEIVEIMGDSIKTSTPKMKKLNPDKNLSEIRKELEKKNINDINILLFSKKPNITKIAEIDREDEEEIFLKEILYENSGSKFLFLSKNDSNLCWDYLNKECKLDYGRTLSVDGIKKASKRAFEMKYCKFNLTGAEKYKRDKLGFISEEDWMKKTNLFFDINISSQNFAELGLLIESSQNENIKNEINSIYEYTEIGKASLKFNQRNLELTDEFKNDVINAINSKDPKKFIKITEEYGQFISTEVILGGRVYFKDRKISSINCVDHTKENSVSTNIGISRNSSKTKAGSKSIDSRKKSNFYSFDHMRLLGGTHPDGKDFDDKAWIESLKNYQNWDCIELKNPISIFQLLPDDLRKESFKSIGKKILYTSIEDYKFILNESDKPEVVDLPYKVSEILQNKEADCDIFATVIDTDESKNDFFNCQILHPSNGKPSLIIHCIQPKFRKCEYNLKIRIMIIGFDTNFKLSDICVKSMKYIYDSKIPCDFYSIPLQVDLGLTNNIPFFGIPVLENLNSLNKSLIIGHNFRNISSDNELKIDVFSYNLKERRFVELPKFTFCTLIILNNLTSNDHELLPFKFSIFKKSPFIDLKKKFTSYLSLKFISLYLSEENYKPFFLKQNIKQIRIKYVDCKCDKTCTVCKNKKLRVSRSENNIKWFTKRALGGEVEGKIFVRFDAAVVLCLYNFLEDLEMPRDLSSSLKALARGDQIIEYKAFVNEDKKVKWMFVINQRIIDRGE
ncbi:hypothetical protein C1645_822458 [Glomus cerebriforme]|uniref:MACPF domain-containing protein n=1 Tax=Glomus cerebriforme TaxID=658196 RepID=A0A397SZX8_9GLOM|nr:hypothetical protein C1645_822458 [Glomus cerebriforme]